MNDARDNLVGRKLVEIRERMRLTRESVAERLGMPKSRLGYYERGEVSLKTETGLILCETLDVNPFFVVGLERSWKRFPEQIKDLPLSPEPVFCDAMEWINRELPFNLWYNFHVNRLGVFQDRGKHVLRGCRHVLQGVGELAREGDSDGVRRRSDLLKLWGSASAILGKMHPTDFDMFEDFNDWQGDLWVFIGRLKMKIEELSDQLAKASGSESPNSAP